MIFSKIVCNLREHTDRQHRKLVIPDSSCALSTTSPECGLLSQQPKETNILLAECVKNRIWRSVVHSNKNPATPQKTRKLILIRTSFFFVFENVSFSIEMVMPKRLPSEKKLNGHLKLVGIPDFKMSLPGNNYTGCYSVRQRRIMYKKLAKRQNCFFRKTKRSTCGQLIWTKLAKLSKRQNCVWDAFLYPNGWLTWRGWNLNWQHWIN